MRVGEYLMKKSIACIGNGFVGGSLTTVMSEKGLDVYVYDKSGKLADGGKSAFVYPAWTGPRKAQSVKELIASCEGIKLDDVNGIDAAGEHHVENFSKIYFVCVPTPMKEDGSCDTSIIDDILREMSEIPGDRIAVVKSTVPPGTTEKWNKVFQETGLRVVFCPEFLREVSALEDMRNQDRIILGGPKPSANVIRDLFRLAFPDVDVHKTSSTNAEMVKYVVNTFLATKVSFANEMSQICDKLYEQEQDVDYDRIIELASLDKRLGTSHWKVPGPMMADDGSGRLLRGWAGSCFIKDVNALLYVAKLIGVDAKVLRGSWEKNLEVRPEKDWENLVGRAVTKKSTT